MSNDYYVSPHGGVVQEKDLHPEQRAAYYGPYGASQARETAKAVQQGTIAPTPALDQAGRPQATQPYPSSGPKRPANQGDPLGIVSLCLAVAAGWLFGAGSVAGLICGLVQFSHARSDNRSPSACAILGVIFGALGVLGWIIALIVIIAAAHDASTLNACYNSLGQYTC